MKIYPHITFRLNKRLDQSIAIDFFKNPGPKSGFDFIEEICVIHPAMKKFVKYPPGEQKMAILKYIDNFYDKRTGDLREAKKDFQFIWNGVENEFFSICDGIFDGLDWPKGKYEGYISILPIGPRFLKNKTFQSCWLWHDNIKGQVIHEMLHFQFYNLIEDIPKAKAASKDKIWHLSEIFNDIVQKDPKFVAIQGYAPKSGYPDHISLFLHYEEIWKKTKKAADFINNSI